MSRTPETLCVRELMIHRRPSEKALILLMLKLDKRHIDQIDPTLLLIFADVLKWVQFGM